jgi:hypothetical protein
VVSVSEFSFVTPRLLQHKHKQLRVGSSTFSRLNLGTVIG